MPKLTKNADADAFLLTLRSTIVGVVRRDGPDLSARCMAIYLIVYLTRIPQTVRGLAGQLDISKPAVTRCLDRLVELGLARRGPDPADGRSILVVTTDTGFFFLTELRGLMRDSHKASLLTPPGKTEE